MQIVARRNVKSPPPKAEQLTATVREYFVPALTGALTEGLARILVTAWAALPNSKGKEWGQMGEAEKAHADYVIRAALRSLDHRLIEEANLRAVQALAQAKYGREYQRLTDVQKRAVYHEAHECCAAYRTAIEGISSPLHPQERIELALPPDPEGEAV